MFRALLNVLTCVLVHHPYRIPTIGTKEDIEASTAKKLREFYDTYYWPNNATLAVYGDVDTATVERLVIKHFGSIQSSPHSIPLMNVIEPPQSGPRTCEIKKPVGISIVELAHKTPAATHSDYPAIVGLVTILAGSFSARLQRLLVDSGLVSDIHTMLLPTIDPSSTSLIVSLAGSTKPQRVLDIMRREIATIAQHGVTTRELKSAVTRILGSLASERDGVMNEVSSVSEAVAAGDWTLAYRGEAQVQALTCRDIQRVAQTHFVPSQETTGILTNTLS